MFAVIRTGGKQYRVAPNDIIEIEKVAGKPGDIIELAEVILLGGDKRALNRRAAGLGAAIATEQDHLGKLDDIAGLARDLLDFDDVVWRHAILLAACANDREHVRYPSKFWA